MHNISKNRTHLHNTTAPCLFIEIFSQYDVTNNPKWNLKDVTFGCHHSRVRHHSDVLMGSRITGISIVYSTFFLRSRWMKTSKVRATGLCEGNSSVTGEFPTQRMSKEEHISIWSRHHGIRMTFRLPHFHMHWLLWSAHNNWYLLPCVTVWLVAEEFVWDWGNQSTLRFGKFHLHSSKFNPNKWTIKSIFKWLPLPCLHPVLNGLI